MARTHLEVAIGWIGYTLVLEPRNRRTAAPTTRATTLGGPPLADPSSSSRADVQP